jgi:uncharacterized coiled-coil protein SlyX
VILLADSTEVRLVKLELSSEHKEEAILNLQSRTAALENKNSEQVNVLGQLSQTVNTLTITVAALNKITAEIAKSHDVIKARFDYVIAILSTIGITVVSGVVAMLMK